MKVDNITLMMFVLNFVEFCFILELIYSSDFHEGRQYFMLMLVLNFALDHKYATIILYYYCDQPSSFSQAPSACGVQCSTERLVREVFSHPYISLFHLLVNGFSVIREYGSTLYVGLARAVSPTNTNFRLTFLLTRLQEALYEDLAV